MPRDYNQPDKQEKREIPKAATPPPEQHALRPPKAATPLPEQHALRPPPAAEQQALRPPRGAPPPEHQAPQASREPLGLAVPKEYENSALYQKHLATSAARAAVRQPGGSTLGTDRATVATRAELQSKAVLTRESAETEEKREIPKAATPPPEQHALRPPKAATPLPEQHALRPPPAAEQQALRPPRGAPPPPAAGVLEERGVRPAPGMRGMTRDQFRQQDSDRGDLRPSTSSVTGTHEHVRALENRGYRPAEGTRGMNREDYQQHDRHKRIEGNTLVSHDTRDVHAKMACLINETDKKHTELLDRNDSRRPEHLRLTNPERGPVLCSVIDVKDPTGQVHFGLNHPKHLPPENLHPVLQDRLHRLRAAHEAQRKHAMTNNKTGLPEVEQRRIMAGPIGYHAELYALNKALKARELRTGVPVTEADLTDFILDNRSFMRKGDVPPRCVNCLPLTDGVTLSDRLKAEEEKHYRGR